MKALRAIIDGVNRPSSLGIILQIILIGLLSVFLASSPVMKSAGDIFAEARLALDSNTYSSAAASLAQIAEIYHWHNNLLLDAEKLSLTAGDAQAAISYFTQAARSAPLPSDSLLALGDAYLAINDPQQAVQAWQLASEAPEITEAVLLRLLELHRSNKNYSQVVEDLKSLIRLYPDEAGYYYQLGLLLAILEPDSALAYLSQVAAYDSLLAENARELSSWIKTAQLYEEPAYSRVMVGRWLGSIGEWRLANLAFQQAVEYRPDYAEAWAYLGESLQQIKSSEKMADDQIGLKELQMAISLDPSSITALVLMSIFWQRQGDEVKAIEYLTQAIELEPDNPMLYAELGHVTAEIGDLPTAQSYYEKAASLAPSELLYWQLLAEFSLEKQIQVRQIALPAARKAVMLATNNPISLDLLGKSLIALDDLLNAERVLRRAISIDPTFAPAHLHLGIIYLIQGNNDLAQTEFQLAERLSPNSSVSEQLDRLNTYVFP